ncbi:MAG: 4-hydroxybenzoyl-CoA reductase subunit alpha [Planctomycetes bacterium]|nr:4-hydroxybenzoyl-CoA reductase subunit alpha [Planctomycetota bacterium]
MTPETGAADAKEEFKVVGSRQPLVDSWKKVTGAAVYGDDVRFPNMLACRVLRSTLPHAKIVRIDTSRAAAMPGVRGIVTGADAKARFGVLPISQDEEALCIEKVRYVGDIVAAVAADDEAAAAAAAAAIEVVYERLPEYTDMKKSAERVAAPIHEWTSDGSNVQKRVDQHFGDVPGALASAAVAPKATFRFMGVGHQFTEPHAVVGVPEPDGRISLYTPTQVPHYVHKALAKVLEMPMHRIRVFRTAVGGGFGGKSDPFPHEMAVCLLARKVGRPVKLVFDREEVFLTNRGRHPGEISAQIGFDAHGKILAYDLDAWIDGGAYASFGVVTTYYNGTLSQGPYRIPNFRYSGRRVYTNKAPCGAMRGHGAVNCRYAVESVIDMACEELKIDPIELRLLNALPAHTKTLNGYRITSNGIVECLTRARDESGWAAKKGKLPFGKGIGVGCGFFISGSALPIHKSRTPQSTVHLKIDVDGGITAHSMGAEIGQGSDTVIAIAVAEILGVPMDFIRVRSEDSDTAPLDLGAYSSRGCFMIGNAAREAAIVVREKLARAAERVTGHPAGDFEFADARVTARSDRKVSLSYFEALTEALADHGAIAASGWYQAPRMGSDYKGAGAGLAPAYSMSAFVAEVDVDLETGIVRCTGVWAAHDCGRAINRLSVEGQIEGCVHMGLGQVLGEEMRYSGGRVSNPSFLDYKILGPKEMPDVRVLVVESNDKEGPFGAKESGEGPLLPILPAVGNALYNAIGMRATSLPVTPDQVFAHLSKLRKSGAGFRKTWETGQGC